jgi:DNA-binding TFAR19-related protein (PDSD5 family)
VYEGNLRRMPSSGKLRRVALVRTDASEEPSAYIIKVTRIGKLGTTLTVTSNRQFLQELHGVTSQKKAFFIVTAVKNLKSYKKIFHRGSWC